MTKNIWPVMPIMMVGSSIASILTIFFGVHDPAPHGGFLVLPVVDGGLMWVVSILIGAVVGGILFVAFKKVEFDKGQKAAPAVEAAAAPAAAPKAVEAAPAPTPAVEPAPSSEGFVKPESVFPAESLSTRDDALSFISNNAVKLGIADDADTLMAAFLKRESEGTTGMMDGFAIPHAKTDTVKCASVMVVKDASGIGSWDTMDQQPVTVAIALLIPETQAGTAHLKILSKVAEALMDEEFRGSVKRESDPAAIAATINARLG